MHVILTAILMYSLLTMTTMLLYAKLYLVNNSFLALDNEIHKFRAYTRSTSRSLAGEQNKSAVTDHAISLSG